MYTIVVSPLPLHQFVPSLESSASRRKNCPGECALELLLRAKPSHPHQTNVTRIASVSCKSTPEQIGKTSTVKGPLTLPSLVSYV
jgi:hypothetical protein